MKTLKGHKLNGQNVNLFTLSILIPAMWQLFIPSFGLVLKSQALTIHFGILLIVYSVSQSLIVLCWRSWIRCWGGKTVALILVIASLIASLLLIIAINEQNIFCYYIAMIFGPGTIMPAGTIVILMLRERLAQDGMKVTSWAGMLMVFVQGAFTWWSFQTHLKYLVLVIAGISVLLIILLIIAEPVKMEPPKLSFRGLLTDPALRITLANLCGLFVLNSFRSLLPLADVISTQYVSILLSVTLFGSAVVGLLFNLFVDQHRQLSSWVIMTCRIASLIALPLMLLLGSWWIFIIGAFLWIIGCSNNPLIKHVNQEQTSDPVLGGTLTLLSGSLMGMVSSGYIWLMEVSRVEHHTSMQWLIIPAVAAIASVLCGWKLHKLPAKEKTHPEISVKTYKDETAGSVETLTVETHEIEAEDTVETRTVEIHKIKTTDKLDSYTVKIHKIKTVDRTEIFTVRIHKIVTADKTEVFTVEIHRIKTTGKLDTRTVEIHQIENVDEVDTLTVETHKVETKDTVKTHNSETHVVKHRPVETEDEDRLQPTTSHPSRESLQIA